MNGSVGYIPAPGYHNLVPQLAVGINWRLGYTDIQLLLRLGPTFDVRAPSSSTFFIGHFMFGALWHFESFYVSFHWGLGGGFLTTGRDPYLEHFPVWVDEIGLGYSRNGLTIGPYIRDMWGAPLGPSFTSDMYSLTFGLKVEYIFNAQPANEYVEFDRHRARRAIAAPVASLALTTLTLFIVLFFMPA